MQYLVKYFSIFLKFSLPSQALTAFRFKNVYYQDKFKDIQKKKFVVKRL